MTADAPTAPRPPYWAWPALLVGQIHRPLARSVRPDVELIHRLPGRFADDLLLPGLAIAVVVVFSWLRLGVNDVFTESLPFIVLALALGLLSPALGVVIVVAHAAGDLARTLASPTAAAEPLDLLLTIAARLISYYLLWLLVVEIPLLARAVPWAAMASARPADARRRRAVAIASSLIAAGMMTFVWTLAVPVLVRPSFTWAMGRPPTFEATVLVEQWVGIIVAAAVVVTGGLAALRLSLSREEHSGPLSFEEFEDFELEQMDEDRSERLELAAQIARHAFVVVVLGGLISGVLELALVAAGAILSRPLALRVLTIEAVRAALSWIPWIVRFVIGFGVTYAVGLVFTTLQFAPLGNTELPLVAAVAFGLFVFQVLLSAEPRSAGERSAADARAAATAAALLLAGGILLATPSLARANEEIEADGPLTRILITSDLNCQVAHAADAAFEFYGGEVGGCGTFVALDGTLYSPASVPAGGSAVGTPFTSVRQTSSGTGSAADPFTIVTVVTLGDSGVTLTQTDAYIVGQENYRTDIQLAGAGGHRDVIVYRAGDCYLQNADQGFGTVDPAAGAVRCVAAADPEATTPVPGPRIQEWVPLAPGSRYLHGSFGEVWSWIGSQQPFPNSCRCDEYLDNGAGLSWTVDIPAGGSVTVSHATNFSPAGRSLVSAPASIPAGSAASAAVVGAAAGIGLSGSAMQREEQQRARRRSAGGRRPKQERGPRAGVLQRLRDGALRDFAGRA